MYTRHFEYIVVTIVGLGVSHWVVVCVADTVQSLLWFHIFIIEWNVSEHHVSHRQYAVMVGHQMLQRRYIHRNIVHRIGLGSHCWLDGDDGRNSCTTNTSNTAVIILLLLLPQFTPHSLLNNQYNVASTTQPLFC
jgi:hypothetical protein